MHSLKEIWFAQLVKFEYNYVLALIKLSALRRFSDEYRIKINDFLRKGGI